MSSFEGRLRAPGWTRRRTANPAPSLLANRAVDMIASLIGTSLEIVAFNFRWFASAARGYCAAVRASLETHQVSPAGIAWIVQHDPI